MSCLRFHESSALRASTTAFTDLRSGLALSTVLAARRNLQESIIAVLQVLIHEATRFVNNAG
jgi:hypothetical protein